ncbi:D-2-hydroxyacid dehydrogenase [Bremerella sp. T1]|uniref:D-2-hydroxyacid dehydrogenase n=1 Tax=Bremerella sp. TYQ1 TaxID=3119568 RepID=UPI001CCD8826|nr:D-2-hydroxyacid dehydrogenase [Bremerella volcania]UBM37523.1 D-2-hydroxyacid dehydrogenase [Bremerella volcania]
MKIALCYQTQPEFVEAIQQVAPDAEVIDAGQEGIADAILEADIFCGHAKVPMPWAQVVEQGKLKWIQSSAAGMDHCLVPEVISSDIVVSSASGLFANQVAEQTFSLLLGLIRSLPVFFRAQTVKDYTRRPTHDLHGKTVGIVGLGGNGRRIAEILSAFQTRIIATDLFPYDCPPHVDALWPADRLDDLLAESDVVILTLPLNASTYHIIDDGRFAAMKQDAWFINVARGQVVKEAALIDALQSGKLLGAGIDVAEIEPLPADSPLWNMKNVIITPHVGAQSASRNADATRLFCTNLQRYLQGEPPINLVDKQLGFPIRKPSDT